MRRLLTFLLLFAWTWMSAAMLCGCRSGPASGGLPAMAVGNPVLVSGDPELVFDEVIDVVDNYFKIENEQRIQVSGNMLTPGRIDTFPVVGASLLEPWRKDFTMGTETLHNTLQVVRRFAVVEIMPTQGGYFVQVQVMKELEDLAQPEKATVGQETRRHDGSLVQIEENFTREGPVRLGWIPYGRDASLEQRILGEIQARLTGAAPAYPAVAP